MRKKSSRSYSVIDLEPSDGSKSIQCGASVPVWDSWKICGAAICVLKVGFNAAQSDTICSIWRNSRINTRRMSLARTDASTQRVLWKLWHDNQATPIIFQTQSRNITTLHCTVPYKAQGNSNSTSLLIALKQTTVGMMKKSLKWV